MFKEELARAAREETFTDAQGRTVRRKHAVVLHDGPKQMVLWADYATAPPHHMRLSLQQRKRYIGGDVRKLKDDKDSYNDNNTHGAYIQMSFNFDEEFKDEEFSTEYPDAPPPDETDDDDDEDDSGADTPTVI
jgi:hypothetical protein